MFRFKLLIDMACMVNGFVMIINVIKAAAKIIFVAPTLLMTVLVYTAGSACMSMAELLSKFASLFL